MAAGEESASIEEAGDQPKAPVVFHMVLGGTLENGRKYVQTDERKIASSSDRGIIERSRGGDRSRKRNKRTRGQRTSKAKEGRNGRDVSTWVGEVRIAVGPSPDDLGNGR